MPEPAYRGPWLIRNSIWLGLLIRLHLLWKRLALVEPPALR
jgi:hypothetical protein